MATPQRLPIVNADDGVWGDIIRQYLMKEHYDSGTDNAANGGHQKITVLAGTTTAGTAPIKLTSGALMTTPEAGAIEFNGDAVYFTQTTGPTRKKFAIYDDTSGATGDIYYRNGSGLLTRLGVGSTGDYLTIASGIPSWTSTIVGKTFDNTNTVTLKDTSFTLQDATDTTKQVRLDVAAAQTTATTRTITLPTVDGTLSTLAGTENLINKTLTTPVINGVSTGTGVATAATANTLVQWDTNKNLSANAVIPGFATINNSVLKTISIADTQILELTGTSSPTVKLPTTSVVAGAQYMIINNSTGTATVQSSGSNTILTMLAGTKATFTSLVATPTTAANWSPSYVTGSSGNMNTSTYDPAGITQQVVGTTATQTLANKTLTNPNISNIYDTNGFKIIELALTTSAVNGIGVYSTAAGSSPGIYTQGSDANLDLYLTPKGSGGIKVYVGAGQTSAIIADGADTNIDLELFTKGTGKVLVNNVPVATTTDTQTLTNKTLILPGSSGTTYTQGKLVYDTDNEALTFYNNDSNVSMQIGQESWIRVSNNSGATIPNGSAVYISGAASGWPTIALAKADVAATTIGAGLATETIADGTTGYVTSIGMVRGLDTSAFTAGQTVYISAATAGALTATAPSAPNYRYRVGIVGVSNASTGTIHVTPSTASLGNGTSNQIGGINNAGTLQEMKSIVGTAGNVSVAHTANTITLDVGANIVTANSSTVLTNKTLTAPVINGTVTGNSVATAAIASTLAFRDTNGNVAMTNLMEGYTTTPTASTTTTLTVASNQQQFFTGTLTQIVVLPVTSTLVLGVDYILVNNSTGAITVNSSGGNQVLVMAGGTSATVTCILTSGTTAASWSYSYSGNVVGSGKKLTANNTLTLNGTDGTVMTFPASNASIARTDNIQTFSGVQTFTSAPVFTALPTGTGVSSSGSAVSTLAARDASANLSANNHINGFTTTVTSATLVTLTIASTAIQAFSGSTAQTVRLPTTSVVAGGQYVIINQSSAVVTVQSSGANTITTMAGGTTLTFTAIIATPTSNTHWYFPPAATGSGDMLKSTYDSANIVQQVVGTTATQTLTNKRITPRIGTVASAATPAINTDTVDQYNITAQAAAITSFTTNLSGTPTDGQRLMIRIKDNGTAQTIAWGATFISSGTATLLSTTIASKTHLSGFIWDSVVAKWVCIAVDAAGY